MRGSALRLLGSQDWFMVAWAAKFQAGCPRFVTPRQSGRLRPGAVQQLPSILVRASCQVKAISFRRGLGRAQNCFGVF